MFLNMAAGVAQMVEQICYGLDGPGSNPGGGEILRTRQDPSWSPPTLLYCGYRISIPGVKRPELCINHSHPSSAEVKERVELPLHSPVGLDGVF
jgi:hypothetical protein